MRLRDVVTLLKRMFPNGDVQVWDNFNWTRMTKAKDKMFRVWNPDGTQHTFVLKHINDVQDTRVGAKRNITSV